LKISSFESFTGAGVTAADLTGDEEDVLLRFLLSPTISEFSE
jgi:hypothetical protein